MRPRTDAPVRCVSEQHCTCAVGCSACRLYRPARSGERRLTGTSLEGLCRCAQLGHCPACSHCVCDDPLTADDLADELRRLPDVTHVRVRRYRELPQPHLSRFWRATGVDGITIGLDHVGEPATEVEVSLSPRNGLLDPLGDTPDPDWASFLWHHRIAADPDPAAAPAREDPRRQMPLCEAGRRFADDNEGHAGDLFAGRRRDAVRAVLLWGTAMWLAADTSCQVPAGLTPKEPPRELQGMPSDYLVWAKCGAPLLVTVDHCSECTGDGLVDLLVTFLERVDLGSGLGARQQSELQGLVPEALLDVAGEHQIPLWPLVLLIVAAHLLPRRLAAAQPEPFWQSVLPLLLSEVPTGDAVDDGDCAELRATLAEARTQFVRLLDAIGQCLLVTGGHLPAGPWTWDLVDVQVEVFAERWEEALRQQAGVEDDQGVQDEHLDQAPDEDEEARLVALLSLYAQQRHRLADLTSETRRDDAPATGSDDLRAARSRRLAPVKSARQRRAHQEEVVRADRRLREFLAAAAPSPPALGSE